MRFSISGLKKNDRVLSSHVERDWIFMLIAFLLVIFLILALSVFLFFSCNKDTVIKPSLKDSGIYSIDRENMNNIIKDFNEREETFNEIKKNR